MKKIIASALALGLLSTSAYASKARLIALGEEEADNFFIQDQRSIFINAAQVHNYKDSVFMEWGNNGFNPAFNSTLDLSVPTSGLNFAKQQGGFLMSHGDFVYGVHMGNESNVSSFLRILASDPATGEYLQSSDNVTDLFFGWGDKVKWGANILHSKSETKTNGTVSTDNEAIAARLGIIVGKYEAYINSSIIGEANGPGLVGEPKFDGSLGLQVGGSYTCDKHGKFYASYKKLDWDQELGTGATRKSSEAGFKRLDLGWGKNIYNSESVRVFSRVALRKIDVEIGLATAAELNHTIVPVVLGFEADATSWLQLRGSVTQNLFSKVEEKGLGQLTAGTLHNVALQSYNATGADGERTISDSTSVNTGASLTFGDITVDGLIGTTSLGSMSLDTLFTRTAVTYKF